jgi:rubredoxin
MLNHALGGMPELEMLLQELLLLESRKEEEPKTEPKAIVRGPSWLDEPKADRVDAPPETDTWTCPRCRSHRCILTNPGDSEAVYRCVVCGYTFRSS